MRAHAFAKINLDLRVLRKRCDGYHDLSTVMQTISLADELVVELADRPGIVLECDDTDLPVDAGNLAWRAAELFYTRLRTTPRVRIGLEKRIPTRAGLGGGSSDAAAILNMLNCLHGEPFVQSELTGMAAELGSDVPFFIAGGRAVAEGRGERLRPLPALPIHALLVVPGFGVETAWAFSKVTPREGSRCVNETGVLPDDVDASPPAGSVSTRVNEAEGGSAPHCLESDGPRKAAALQNDLEEPVFAAHPVLEEIRGRLLELGADDARMTGSGSTIFGLFSTAEMAAAAQREWAPVQSLGRAIVVHSVRQGMEIVCDGS